MEYFESAHKSRKDSRKGKSNYVKKHLRQMLNAYQRGNNEEIKKSAETALTYEAGDLTSLSDYSELSIIKEMDNSNNTEANSSFTDQSSKSILSEPMDSTQDTMNSTTGSDDIKSLTQSEYYSEKELLSSNYSTSMNDESNSCSSSISISSSLVSKDSESSNAEQFDPDGTLASTILEKLRKNKKLKKCTDNLAHQKVTKKESKTKKQQNTKLAKKISYIDEIKESTDNSSNAEVENMEQLEDSDSNSPFVSVLATDMCSYSLSDIVGDYVHPTTKNLPSDKQNIINSNLLFQSGSMIVDDEIGSLIPELDEELAIEDLIIDTDSRESVHDTSANDTLLTDMLTDNELLKDTDTPINIYSGENCYIVKMKHPAELYIHGKVKVSAVGGKAEIFGYTLNETNVEVFAPYCNYAYCLKTVGKASIFKGLFSKLSMIGLSTSEAENIVTSIEDNDAVICLSKLNSRNMDFVDNNFNVVDLFSKRNDSTPNFLKEAAENLSCSLYLSPHKQLFEEKSCWEQVVNCGMEHQSRGIICGGKGTGKSTFLRYYVNRLVAKGPVLVIDLDPGQAEFTMAGNLSVTIVDKPLIGPNFTHLKNTEKTLNIGMINVMDYPARYISAVSELLQYCHSNDSYHHLPWIVNTMGMCNYMGLKFITYIITQLQPTFLYQIDSKAIKNKFEYELDSSRIKELSIKFSKDNMFRNIFTSDLDYTFILEKFEEVSTPQKSASKLLTPRDERYLNILAYFGLILETHNSTGLLEIVPYEVSLNDLNIALNVKIPEGGLTKVINGKIIGLCQMIPRDKGKVFTLTDKALLCHGHGLIRGVDTENNKMFILTPITIDRLCLVDTLLYSDWMPELGGTERYLPNGTFVPYRTGTTQHHKLMSPPKRRFNPIQLLKMSRNT